MFKITIGIEGMSCGMCEAHINNAIRNAFQVKKVTSSHTKNQAVIIADENIPEQNIRNVIIESGYEVTNINCEPYEKKGLRSVFK